MRGRGQPGDFDRRLARIVAIGGSPTVSEPMAVAAVVLDHQRARVREPTVAAIAALLAAGSDERRSAGCFPLLHLHAAADPLLAELRVAVTTLDSGALPEPLRAAGAGLLAAGPADALRVWLDDAQLVDPRAGFWLQAAAGAPLELAVAGQPAVASVDWHGRACPFCGGLPQVSVIAERPGDLLGGSPRSLVCSRCAAWWPFPRATCVACGEDDVGLLTPYVADGIGWARIDSCRACGGYVKTFDLRQDGAREVVPLVDDIASLSLDLWAHGQGLHRAVRSVAGV